MQDTKEASPVPSGKKSEEVIDIIGFLRWFLLGLKYEQAKNLR